MHFNHNENPTLRWIPTDDGSRVELHNEVHARPPPLIELPALSLFVAVLNAGVTLQQELNHLRRLEGGEMLELEDLTNNFLRLQVAQGALKWERHSEFTRYSIVQDASVQAVLGSEQPSLIEHLSLPKDWLAGIPGRTVVAIELAIVKADLPGDNADDRAKLMRSLGQWFGHDTVIASEVGNGHSWAVTDFRLGELGLERMLVVMQPESTAARAGRLAQRLVEIETYRLMALRGLPVAKRLAPSLSQAEAQLARITSQMENMSVSEQELLDQLVSLAARVEHSMAEHTYRFAATRAYWNLVTQRIAELRERPIPGAQSMGNFMHRRLSPAMKTVEATEQRLNALSERITHSSAMLRTRVDIATATRSQQLLEKLTRGQEIQLQMQTTVEGLSIAAISYYVVSLLVYVCKGLKAAGLLPVDPELMAALLIPVVLWGTWLTTHKIHERFARSLRAGRSAPESL
jgi:uncharacterized membrane-anchored protein